jgi:hypothetical protein
VHAIGEVIVEGVGHRERQPRFADSTGAGQRQEGDGLIQQERPDSLLLRLTTDEASARDREQSRRAGRGGIDHAVLSTEHQFDSARRVAASYTTLRLEQ